MNLSITTTSPDAAAQNPALAQAPVLPGQVLPAGDQAALLPQVGVGVDALLDLAAALPQAGAPALQFGQWLGQAAEAVDAAPASPDALPLEQQAGEEQPLLDVLLTSAMSMPVMPLAQAAQATLAAVAAALPGAQVLPKTEPAAAAPLATAQAAQPGAVAQNAVAALLDVAAQPGDAAAAAPQAAAAPAVATPAAASLPRADFAGQEAAAKPAAATQPASASFAATLGEVAKEQPGVNLADRGTVAGPAPAAPAAQSAAADTVTLSGPPTAWRQNLREALGERLQMQVGRSSEQAVIRLDPPNLGQVEIAIRHSAGTLEVTISASHREVVRQLQAVSENLRSDLAQRQFTDVAVNVTPTRPSAQSGQMFGDGQGRGRQQDGRQDEAVPGQALAEAHQDGAFSLGARH